MGYLFASIRKSFNQYFIALIWLWTNIQWRPVSPKMAVFEAYLPTPRKYLKYEVWTFSIHEKYLSPQISAPYKSIGLILESNILQAAENDKNEFL